MKKLLQAVWSLFLETVFPAVCCGCRREGGAVCKACIDDVVLKEQIVVETLDCQLLDGIVACSKYVEGMMMARLVHTLKYDFVVDLAQPLGRFLVDALRTSGADVDVVCAVPLHKKRFRWRGFNQAELLAKVLCEETGLPMLDSLKRIHFKKAQMELKKEERKANVQKAFTIVDGSRVKGRTVLLVDDVATTLSTLEACASELKEAGALRVYGIVLARVY